MQHRAGPSTFFMSPALAALINATFAAARTETSATLVHEGNTYSVIKGYGPQLGHEMLETAYLPNTEDMTVILQTADLAAPNPAQDDRCTLDGDNYLVSGSITKTSLYWMLTLRQSR